MLRKLFLLLWWILTSMSVFGWVYAAPADHIIISEVEYDAIQSSTDTDYERFELFNPTTGIINLSWRTIQENFDPLYMFNNSAVMYPWQYFLIVNSGAFSTNYPTILPDVIIKPSLPIWLRLANTTDFFIIKG
jgi:hypothetical protein